MSSGRGAPPRDQENEQGLSNSENLTAGTIMPNQVQRTSPGDQTKPGSIHEDHHGAGDRNGLDVASNPFGSRQHGHRRAGQYGGGNIVERGASADQRDRVPVGGMKTVLAPDDFRPQPREDLPHKGSVGTKHFRRKELKENRAPDLMRRNGQQ